jgi:hypothetical protein
MDLLFKKYLPSLDHARPVNNCSTLAVPLLFVAGLLALQPRITSMKTLL